MGVNISTTITSDLGYWNFILFCHQSNLLDPHREFCDLPNRIHGATEEAVFKKLTISLSQVWFFRWARKFFRPFSPLCVSPMTSWVKNMNQMNRFEEFGVLWSIEQIFGSNVLLRKCVYIHECWSFFGKHWEQGSWDINKEVSLVTSLFCDEKCFRSKFLPYLPLTIFSKISQKFCAHIFYY